MRPSRRGAAGGGWTLALRLARRELRAGLGGFRIFLACLALGVGAIAAILSFSRAVEEGLRADARQIMGGDVAIGLAYRPATPEQVAFMRAAGEVAQWNELRAMARADRGEARPTLVQMKAVDGLYPLFGRMEFEGGGELGALLARRDGVWGAVAEETALRRMGVAVGDRVRLGELSVEIRAVIAREPDRGLQAFGIGPRIMIALAAMPQTALVQPGSLLNYEYRVRLRDGADGKAWIGGLNRAFPEAGWRARSLDEAGAGLRTWLDRLTVFLGLIGLAALLVGGVGIGNAVSSYLASRARTVAILKCLGAPEALVFRTYLAQIAALAAVGVALGLLLGAILPYAAGAALGDLLPVRARIGLYVEPLAAAAAFGVLVSLLFALWPLAVARAVPAQTLMRGAAAPVQARPRPSDLAWIVAVAAVLAGFTLLTAADRRVAAWFVVGALAAFVAFPLLARLVMAAAKAAGRPRNAAWRLALANLHRPGAPTPIVMLSLGLGLTVLVATALIERNLQSQITSRVPKDAPAFFFVDIQAAQIDDFAAAVKAVPGVGALERVPSLRGRIVRIAGRPVSEIAVPSGARWAVDGDRGLTYSARLPEGSRIVAGEWWPEDYRGPPLISFDAELAAAFGVGVGDTITINILGRDVEARIANLRRIDWTTLAINFTFVFAPGALERAPQTFLATVQANGPAEEAVFRAVTDRFPNVTVVRVKDALENAGLILGNIGLAARIVGFVSIAAGLLVLAGAMLATQRRRVHDAVVMKVLGATRGRIVLLFCYEFAVLGLATAVAAGALGSAGSYFVIRRLMNLEWSFEPEVALLAAVGAMAVTLAFGLAGTVGALKQRPLALLRNE